MVKSPKCSADIPWNWQQGYDSLDADKKVKSGDLVSCGVSGKWEKYKDETGLGNPFTDVSTTVVYNDTESIPLRTDQVSNVVNFTN